MNIIRKIHFIWLGSPLSSSNSKNLSKWTSLKCDYDIYVWYDSALLNGEQELIHLQYIDELGVTAMDIRDTDMLELSNLTEFYDYETGLVSRPGINPINQEIKNWGMASDIARILILYWYGGFYCDIDMSPVDMCEVINTCQNKFCINREPDGKINNNALYFDPNDNDCKSAINEYFNIVQERYSDIMNNYTAYLLFDFVMVTIYTTGPDAVQDGLDRSGMDVDLSYLDIIHEDPEMSTLSWVPRRRSKAFDILYHDCVSDMASMIACVLCTEISLYYYKLSIDEVQQSIDYIKSEVDINPYNVIDADHYLLELSASIDESSNSNTILSIYNAIDYYTSNFYRFYVKAIGLAVLKDISDSKLTSITDDIMTIIGNKKKFLQKTFNNSNVPSIDFFIRLNSLVYRSFVTDNIEIYDNIKYLIDVL